MTGSGQGHRREPGGARHVRRRRGRRGSRRAASRSPSFGQAESYGEEYTNNYEFFLRHRSADGRSAHGRHRHGLRLVARLGGEANRERRKGNRMLTKEAVRRWYHRQQVDQPDQHAVRADRLHHRPAAGVPSRDRPLVRRARGTERGAAPSTLDELLSSARGARPGMHPQLVMHDPRAAESTYFAMGESVDAPVVDAELLQFDRAAGTLLSGSRYDEGFHRPTTWRGRTRTIDERSRRLDVETPDGWFRPFRLRRSPATPAVRMRTPRRLDFSALFWA